MFEHFFDIPEGSRQAKGQAIVNLINIEQDEKLQTVLNLGKGDDYKFLLMITDNGTIKKTKLRMRMCSLLIQNYFKIFFWNTPFFG